MRNLTRYPITLDEIESCLAQIRDELIQKGEDELRVGDMRPLLVDAAITIIRRLGFVTHDLGKANSERALPAAKE